MHAAVIGTASRCRVICQTHVAGKDGAKQTKPKVSQNVDARSSSKLGVRKCFAVLPRAIVWAAVKIRVDQGSLQQPALACGDMREQHGDAGVFAYARHHCRIGVSTRDRGARLKSLHLPCLTLTCWPNVFADSISKSKWMYFLALNLRRFAVLTDK